MTGKRWAGLTILIFATALTAVYACRTGVDPAVTTIAGSFGSIAVLMIIAYVLKVRDDLFFCGMIFRLLLHHQSVRSDDMYRSFGPYDKIVHFFSGVLPQALAR